MKAEPLDKGLSRFRDQSGTAFLRFDTSKKQIPRDHNLRPRGAFSIFSPKMVFADRTLVQDQGTNKSVHSSANSMGSIICLLWKQGA
jgi:hypothetical protein